MKAQLKAARTISIASFAATFNKSDWERLCSEPEFKRAMDFALDSGDISRLQQVADMVFAFRNKTLLGV